MLIIKIAILFFFLCETCLAQISTSLWQTQKSQHFIVFFQEAPSGYIDEIINQAERYYQSITEELGFTRFQDFWTWEKRAKVYLYKDRQDYQKMTAQPQWSSAHVQVIKRQIYSYPHMENFFDVILPHELAHIIFREFIGYRRKLPLWLDEGIASFFEKSQKDERLMVAKALIKTKFFLTLGELEKFKIGAIIMPEIFYIESASVIEFLLKVYGKDKFVEFCRKLRDLGDAQGWDTALKSAYEFKSVSEFNKAWMEFLIQ